MEKRILMASPRGFCMGVNRAIRMLEDTMSQEMGTVYVRKEIVHNIALVERFKSQGAVFVNEVDDVPEGSVVVFSAHGVAPIVWEKAKGRNLRVVDTTCPLVKKVHDAAINFKEQGYTIILIGEVGHKEVIGVMGEAPENIRFVHNKTDIDNLSGIDGSHVVWLSQTTLNVDETKKIIKYLRDKFPLLKDPSDSCICYATRDHQLAVKGIANECDLFIVVGSQTSSNTKRLVEVAYESGAKNAIRIDEPEELFDVDLSTVYTIGVTSGVSVTEEQLMRVVIYLNKIGYTYLENNAPIK